MRPEWGHDEMPTKSARVTLDGPGLRFAGLTGSGHQLVLDNAEGDRGPRPAELLPLALAACTAMDVIAILRKKRQDVTAYDVRVTGTQADDHPNAYTSFEVVHAVAGPAIEVEAVRRAIELSATRYCTVGATLATGRVSIDHRYVVTDSETHRETTGSVVGIGPLGATRELIPA